MWMRDVFVESVSTLSTRWTLQRPFTPALKSLLSSPAGTIQDAKIAYMDPAPVATIDLPKD
jgi:hypothetical protein